jgi:hypothetical protein
MKKIFKILIVVYFALVFPILFYIADFFILDANPKIYSLIPQDADIVIEINTKNFIQEVAYQRIFNESYFLKRLPKDSEENLVESDNLDFGLNPFSQIIVFRENWADKNIWYGIVAIKNKSKFESFIKDKGYQFNIEYADNYAIILFSNQKNSDIITHQQKMAQYKLKSFDSKIDLSEVFNTNNELNVYLAPKNSKDIIDGYLHFNFEKDRVTTNGTFTPVGKTEDIPFINYELNNNKALSLRSSLNLFNSVYLFNKNISLKNLPKYTQLCIDFDGTTLKTSHSDIPIVAYPELNIQFDIIDSLNWRNYLINLNDNNTFIVDSVNHQLIINTESQSFLNYDLTPHFFKIYQHQNNFNKKSINNTYFSLNIHPNSILEKTMFEKDSLNPPTFVDGIKIGIIESLMDDMNFWNDIDYINFTITADSTSTDFISHGNIIYLEKEGHSIIESIVLFQKFIGSVGAFLE